MTNDDLDKLDSLISNASKGPWHIRNLDDDHCASAIAIAAKPEVNDNGISMRAGNWPTEQVVAATLIQNPPYIVPHDELWDENAELIVALRNAADELIRLAREGLKASRS